MVVSIIPTFNLPFWCPCNNQVDPRTWWPSSQSKGTLSGICYAKCALLVLGEINVASGTWYTAIDLMNKLIPFLSKKSIRNSLHLHRKNNSIYSQFCCRTPLSLSFSVVIQPQKVCFVWTFYMLLTAEGIDRTLVRGLMLIR